MHNWCICCFFRHILTKCAVQEAKFPVKISSGSVARRDLIPALKGYGIWMNGGVAPLIPNLGCGWGWLRQLHSLAALPPLPMTLWLVRYYEYNRWMLGEGICRLHAKHTRRMMSPVACPAFPHFFTSSHKRHDFRETDFGREMCCLICCTPFVWNVSHCKENSARYCHTCT
jgi:hypothetical protein